MANAFLKKSFNPVKRWTYVAWLLDVASTLALVGQAYALSAILVLWLDMFLGKTATGDDFWRYLSVLLVCMVSKALFGYARDYLLSKAGLTVVKNIRQQLLAKLGELGLVRRYFGSDGVLASKVLDEPEHLFGYARFEVQKMTAVSTPIILAVCISFYSMTTALILLLTAPFVPVLMAFVGIATARKSREQMDALAQLGGRFLDWIRGMNTLARLGAVDVAITDIDRASENYRKRTMSVLKIAFLNSAMLEFVSALAIALVAVYLGLGLLGQLPWSEGQALTDYGTALFILLLVPEFYAPLRRLGAEYHIKGQAVACAKAIAPMLDFKHKNNGGANLVLSATPSFALTDITVFGDDGRVRLSPTTLNFLAGKKTALLGQSGTGKSTILQVLLGFGDYEGDITIEAGGQKASYASLDVAHLRCQFGYLSQSVALLPISIRENLQLSCTNASKEQLIQVLKDVELWQVIEQLPDGLDTKLGERGSGLSGGQVQRLAIAQLLLQDAKVWLLDEPTEHLDPQTAKQIKQLLHRLAQDKTVIWVTHDEEVHQFDVVHRLGVVV